MGVTYGFYNSQNNDRVYDADQFSSFLDGIVYDGVYGAYGNKFYVTAGTGLEVIVDTGRAWFDHTWTLNDTYLYLSDLPVSDVQFDRIDAVILEVNKDTRENQIRYITGTASENPVKPTLTKTQTLKQYAIAYITRPVNSEVILQNNIEYVVGSAETPLCSALSLAGVPSGGTVGQVLAKSSSESGAVNWYNVNQLPTEDWLHPTGVTDSDIIAAFRFKGAASEADALQSVNSGTKYTLSKSGSNVTWSSGNGFFIPAARDVGLKNTDIQKLTWGTVAVKYSGAQTGDAQVGLIHKSYQYGLYANFDMMYAHPIDGGIGPDEYIRHYPVVTLGNDQKDAYYSTAFGQNKTEGVLSTNFSGDHNLYMNAISGSLSNNSSSVSLSTVGNYKANYLFGQLYYERPWYTNEWVIDFGSVYIHAAIIFNRVLSDTETQHLHSLMMTM